MLSLRSGLKAKFEFMQVVYTLLRKKVARPLKRFLKKISAKNNLKDEAHQLVGLTGLQAQTMWRAKIPGLLHQTSPNLLLHPSHYRAVQCFRAKNPGLEFKVWDDIAIEASMASNWGDHPIYKVFTGAKFGQMKADIFRYCVVFETGGFYLDINKTVDLSLADLVANNSEGLISFEKNMLVSFPSVQAASRLLRPHNVVLQWCFGFVPEHPILNSTINRIVHIAPFFSGVEFNRALHAVVSFTGPGSFTWAVHKFLEENEPTALQQLQPDFDNLGITRLPRSENAFSGNHYGYLKNVEVFDWKK